MREMVLLIGLVSALHGTPFSSLSKVCAKKVMGLFIALDSRASIRQVPPAWHTNFRKGDVWFSCDSS